MVNVSAFNILTVDIKACVTIQPVKDAKQSKISTIKMKRPGALSYEIYETAGS